MKELRTGGEGFEPGGIAVVRRDQPRVAKPAPRIAQDPRDDLGNRVEAEGGELRLDGGACEPGSRVLGQSVELSLEEQSRRGRGRVGLLVFRRLFFGRGVGRGVE